MLGSILDLKGPEFLVFYIAIGACVLLLARVWMNASERGDVIGRIDLKEPLTIAYLRGGAAEVLRVAAFSLVDRGLVLFDGRTLCAQSKIAGSLVRRPLEKALLERLVVPTGGHRMAARPCRWDSLASRRDRRRGGSPRGPYRRLEEDAPGS